LLKFDWQWYQHGLGTIDGWQLASAQDLDLKVTKHEQRVDIEFG
jgi:hypothetical protein